MEQRKTMLDHLDAEAGFHADSEHTERVKQEPELVGREYAENRGNELQLTVRAGELFGSDRAARDEWQRRAIEAFRQRKREMGGGPNIVEE